MNDDRDPPDEKVNLGQTARALRRAKRLSQNQVGKGLGVRRGRVSEIETGTAADAKLIEELAQSLGFRAIHIVKSMDLFEYLREEQRKPVDPIGPTPQQEVGIHEACSRLGTEMEAMFRDRIRSENLRRAIATAAGQWQQIELLPPPRIEAEIRGDTAFHTWGFCLFLCIASVRQATDDPGKAIEIGRFAVVAARCCGDLPWADRLVAYALAHLGNTFRVQGDHRESEKRFDEANPLWSSPAAAAADPGVLDPGRILDLEASLRKDQRQLPEALELLERALPISRVPGRILVSKSIVLTLMGYYEEAIETLRRAAEFLVDPEPGDVAAIDYNIGVNLCHLNRFDEAAALANSSFKIAVASKNRIRILRCRWLRARVFDGQGNCEAAVSIYRKLVYAFKKRGMTYDLALVALELAALLLALGQTRECRSLTNGLPEYFEAKRIYPEALAALKVFCDSIRQETATEALARQVAAFLYRARGNPGLRFVPAQS